MSLNLRLCTLRDVEIIYNISNDPKVRKNSLNIDEISYENHIKWYKDSLINANRIMYVIQDKHVIVGQIRLDKQDDRAIISYSIEKNSRNKGYGSKALNLIKNEALKNNISTIEGVVKKDNIASKAAFKKNGFLEIEEQNYFRYIYSIKDGDNTEINKDR